MVIYRLYIALVLCVIVFTLIGCEIEPPQQGTSDFKCFQGGEITFHSRISSRDSTFDWVIIDDSNLIPVDRFNKLFDGYSVCDNFEPVPTNQFYGIPESWKNFVPQPPNSWHMSIPYDLIVFSAYKYIQNSEFSNRAVGLFIGHNIETRRYYVLEWNAQHVYNLQENTSNSLAPIPNNN